MGRSNYQYLPLTESTIQSPRTDNQRYDSKKRLRHTLLNGGSIWTSIDPELRRSIFEPAEGPKGPMQKIEADKIEEARTLHSGIISWLSLLYSGVDGADNLYSADSLNHEIQDDGSVVQKPEIHFDFEQMLGRAINKVENRRGRQVVDFSIEVETEPIPDDPWQDFDLADLLHRFEERDPTLTTRELAHLESEGEIDADAREKYREAVLQSVQEFDSDRNSEHVDWAGPIDESELPDGLDD